MIILTKGADVVLEHPCMMCGRPLGTGEGETAIGGVLCNANGAKPEDERGPVCVDCAGKVHDYKNAKMQARPGDQRAQKELKDAIKRLCDTVEATRHHLSSKAGFLGQFERLAVHGDLDIR